MWNIKKYRNYLNTLIKSTKRNYCLRRFSDFRVNTRKIWETIHELSNNKTKKNSTTNSVFYNQIIDAPEQISDAFNDCFSNVAPELASKLPSTQISHKSFLRGNYPNSMAIVITHIDTVNGTEIVPSILHVCLHELYVFLYVHECMHVLCMSVFVYYIPEE